MGDRYPKKSDCKVFLNLLGAKTLVFDFDETLAKVVFDATKLESYDERLDLLTKKKTHHVFIKFRPRMKEMLYSLKEHFELILFTSSSEAYCKAIIGAAIENDGQIFDYKLYKKQCIVRHKQSCLKDLDQLLNGR